jgi:hypothetical protein
MTYELKDWLNSINQTKNNIMETDSDSVREYLHHTLSTNVYLEVLIVFFLQMK